MSEIRDFDDLAKDTKFKFSGKTYFIPAISNEKANELFKMSKKAKKKDGQIDSPDIEVEKEEQDSIEFIKEQAEFICASVLNEDGTPVTEETVNKWPMKVSLAVVKLINECITGIKEDTPEEKKQ